MLDSNQRQFFRNQLRCARAVALADAEGFQAVLNALELIGPQLGCKPLGLGAYADAYRRLASASSLSDEIPQLLPTYHTCFSVLYDELRQARNDSVHQGAHARSITDHAVKLTIVLEDALMANDSSISQFMVRDVIEAKPWHPVSYARQQMLSHGFSYLPLHIGGGWRLVPEHSVARYIRGTPPEEDRRKRLATHIADAVASNGLDLEDALSTTPDARIASVLKSLNGRPILVLATDCDELLGILTASDIL